MNMSEYMSMSRPCYEHERVHEPDHAMNMSEYMSQTML